MSKSWYFQRISDLHDPLVPGAINVLIEAYKNDAFRDNVAREDAQLIKLLHSSSIHAAIVGGDQYVAIDETTGAVVGAASWYGPGKNFMETAEQREQGCNEFLIEVEAGKPQAFADWYTQMSKQMDSLPGASFGTPEDPDGYHFKTNNWALHNLAVDPAFRRRGIAKALLQIGEDEAAAVGGSTYAETNSDDAVTFYERHGYELAAKELVEGYITPNFHFYLLLKRFDIRVDMDVE
ncbi:hypothetical protein C8J56DRAFT_445459 [Mycena floridula]|nr:hypothetical protein C8J56DRAFT_445459 [Mycena floridula]